MDRQTSPSARARCTGTTQATEIQGSQKCPRDAFTAATSAGGAQRTYSPTRRMDREVTILVRAVAEAAAAAAAKTDSDTGRAPDRHGDGPPGAGSSAMWRRSRKTKGSKVSTATEHWSASYGSDGEKSTCCFFALLIMLYQLFPPGSELATLLSCRTTMCPFLCGKSGASSRHCREETE